MSGLFSRLRGTLLLGLMGACVAQASPAWLKLPGWMQAPAYQPSRAFTLDGWIDHTSTWVSDSSYAGAYGADLRLHTARLIVGAHGELERAGGLAWLVRAGGTMAQNSLYEQRIYTPEFQADVGWTPTPAVEVGVFVRHGWRRPNAFLIDSLRLRDLVLGARLGLRPLANTELGVTAGNRRVLNGNAVADHRFMRAELEHRVPGWRQFLVRAWGESAWYGLADSLDFDLQRSLAGLNLSGELPGGVNLHSSSALVQRKGIRRVLGQNRLRTTLWDHHRLSVNAGADYTELEAHDVYRRHADASWRWMPGTVLGAELRASAERVQVKDEDLIHRRDVMALAVFDWKPLAPAAAAVEAAGRHQSWAHLVSRGLWLKRHMNLRGDVGGGWAETRTFGRGITGRATLDWITPVEPLPWLGFSLRSLQRGEIFRMQDRDVVAPWADETQKELDQLTGLHSTLNPHGTLQGGHRLEWRRHLGSHLVYSDDTLRNTVNNELWLKYRGRRLQGQISGMALRHLVEEDPVELEHRLSLHLRWQPVRLASFNVRGMWRPQRDPLPERMWLRSFIEFELNKLTLTTDLRFVGDPAHLGTKDTEAWIHVLRRLW